MQAPLIPLPQTKAVTACEDLWPGGYLASIESECENDFVVELLGQTSGWEQTYLGATDLDQDTEGDTEGTWTWIKTGGSTFWEGGDPTAGGAAVSGMYANFLDGEPNNGGAGQDCLVIGESDGEWRDQLCSKTSQFLCETAATEGGASITPAPTTLGSTIVCSSTCDEGWTQTDDCLCYQVQNDLRTWLEARAACSALRTGATLVSLTSAALEFKILELFGGFSSDTLNDASANGGDGANGYWTGGNDLTNLANDDIITSDDTEFKWDFDQDVFWRRDTSEAVYCCEVDGKYSNWLHISDTNIMPNHKKEEQNCVKMKFVADDSGNLEKAGWDDVDCVKRPIKSVCQYSVL